MRFQLTAVGLACATLLAACGGGGSGEGSGGEGGTAQSVSFLFPGGETLAVPPIIATIDLKATASSGGPITYVSNTPNICSVSGATLSLLKAGECSVNANQVGGNGYIGATARQLFVIPKRPQVIQAFRNPGAQPLDATPVSLAATSSLGLPVVFTSSTPAVCSISGSTMQKLADGLCIVTATADGGEIYATATLERTIPVGTALAPELTFLSGYKSAALTIENGKVEPVGGSSLRNWWCDGWCDISLAADGTVSNTYNWLQAPPADGWWHNWAQIDVYAPGVANKSNTGSMMEGMRIDAQAQVKFTLGLNQEWFDSKNNNVNVDLVLGHYNKKANNDNCYVTLRATFKPGSPALTNYAVRLKDLVVVDGGCELPNLDPWGELQDYPIVHLSFASTEGNVDVPSATAPAPNYPTTVKLKGKITFQ
ncbi:hypothetical protein [Massilia pseudoviolaceinigra]|uniref:hypothetical protein n=1 Tax=Massilia pseudoviolaceinigra TaxID=3057165 RepID=UPI002796959F|nr:hypothetical protein [Massilia sp. CCM 9206]MDQ1919187.1 hypothetical protein [Massilia sp. CCM 9206]